MPIDDMEKILKELASPGSSRTMDEFVSVALKEAAEFLAPPQPPLPPVVPVATRVAVPRPQRYILENSAVGLHQIETMRPPGPLDEVNAYLRNKEIAAEGHSDEFQQRIALQDHDREELHEEANFVRTNPRSATKFPLGQTVSVPSNTNRDNALAVAEWIGEDVDATNATVTLALVGPPPSGVQSIVRPFAVVKFGSRGNFALVEVDIGQGCQFTVSGSAVYVAVAMDNDGSTNAGVAVLTGMISFRNVSHGVPMTRTKYIAASASATTVQVPPFAKSVLFYNNDSTQTYTIDFKDFAGNKAYTLSVAASAAPQTAATPLSGDIEQITVTPGGGTPAVRLVFQLAL